MTNWYKILGVSPSASLAEIKRAFRNKAKNIHPDIPTKNKFQQHKNEETMRLLLQAYEVLTSPSLKANFDLTWTASKSFRQSKTKSFDYRQWLSERKDLESRAKLIFFDLIHNKEEEAVNEYLKNLTKDDSFTLKKYFDREDFMDLGFILAEELVFRNKIYEAFCLLLDVIELENTKPYFKHFFEDVLSYTRNIIRTKLSRYVPDEKIIESLIKALELGFEKKDEALILKVLAETYYKMGDYLYAKKCIAQAVNLDTSVTVITKLKKLLEENLD